MAKLGRFILWLFIAPGDIISDRLGISQDENRNLVRMLINSIFWVAWLAGWLWMRTSTIDEFRSERVSTSTAQN